MPLSNQNLIQSIKILLKHSLDLNSLYNSLSYILGKYKSIFSNNFPSILRFYQAFKICSAQKIWEIYGLKLCWAKNCNKSEMKNATESYPIIRILFIRKLQSLRRKKVKNVFLLFFAFQSKYCFVHLGNTYEKFYPFMKFITEYQKFHFSGLIAK